MLSFLGGLIGGFIGVVAQIWFKKETRKKDADYLAMRVVPILRQYVLGCVAVAQDNCIDPTDMEAQVQPRQVQIKRPEYVQYPSDINWKSIDQKYSFQILELPITARHIEDNLSWFLEHESGGLREDITFMRQDNYWQLAEKAFELERWLTKKYNIDEVDYYSEDKMNEYFT